MQDLASSLATDWLSALASRGGPLVPAARRFMHAHFPAFDGFPGSATLLRELARAMQHWLTHEHVDADAERDFVEGAGATLGILLIAHVGDASHVARGPLHRIRLRKHGFFDPFAAVDRALDAEHVRRALAREVECAEAEANGSGPVARVVGALARALATRTPPRVIRDHFEGTVTLTLADGSEPIEIDLQRAIDSTRDQSASAAEQVVQRYLSMLPGEAATQEGFEDLRPRLLPRIVRSDVLLDLSSSGRTLLFSLPFVAELSLALVVQESGRARYLRAREAEDFPIASQELYGAALANLAACSTHTRLIPAEKLEGVYLARTGDGRDSARVLLPTLYGVLRGKFGSEICVGLPHRDTLVVCAAHDARAVSALTRKVAEDAARAPHKLSSEPFMLNEHGLSPMVRL